MVHSQTSEIFKAVVEKVGTYAGVDTDGIGSAILHRDLKLDGFDFIELCEDLERTFKINLRPFFEEGQPEVRRLLRRQKFARDVTVEALATEVERSQGVVR